VNVGRCLRIILLAVVVAACHSDATVSNPEAPGPNPPGETHTPIAVSHSLVLFRNWALIATTTVEERFSVAYLVFNTVMNLTTQDEQIACFQNVAAHLEPGGCFVIEVGVPGLQRLPPGETVRAFNVSATRLGFDEYDVVSQGLISHHYSVVDGKLEVLSVPFRYVWPSELDLMARLAGMTLRERWSGWKREPFTSDSTKHVSVWEKTASSSGG